MMLYAQLKSFVRAERRRLGQCPMCGTITAPSGYIYCPKHRQQRTDATFRFYGRKRCQVRRKWREYARRPATAERKAREYLRKRDERRAQDLCIGCGLTPVHKFARCLECRQRTRENRQGYATRLVAEEGRR